MKLLLFTVALVSLFNIFSCFTIPFDDHNLSDHYSPIGYKMSDNDAAPYKWQATEHANRISRNPLNYVPVAVKEAKHFPGGHFHTFQFIIEFAESTCLKSKVNHAQLKAKPCKAKIGGKHVTAEVSIASHMGVTEMKPSTPF
ncbi:hypothetical protein L596_028549 [Steinernema carpocapsae]|uniref:Cystatin domain-containing protein n=1 Tax=Steinernema carpocapsae TaxID=34508 RepID=A0A4U5LZQ0_STECR|nr:hypothetical protein L596_028549 [Steinernema carpocapsae]